MSLRFFKVTKTLKTISIDDRLRERERPEGPIVMYQRWSELLFLHWPMEAKRIQQTLPEGLYVDTFDGNAWIGVVPFQMQAVRPRYLPAAPGLSAFPELNLRTYVYDAEGRPGVWFYSLDTPNRIANWIAQKFFHLNYRRARMRVAVTGGQLRYQSELWMGTDWDARQYYTWQREGKRDQAVPGSLEFFLVERYRLFAYDPARRRLLSGQVHHTPYLLQSGSLNRYTKRLFELSGFVSPSGPPASVLMSAGVDVQIYPLTTFSARS